MEPTLDNATPLPPKEQRRLLQSRYFAPVDEPPAAAPIRTPWHQRLLVVVVLMGTAGFWWYTLHAQYGAAQARAAPADMPVSVLAAADTGPIDRLRAENEARFDAQKAGLLKRMAELTSAGRPGQALKLAATWTNINDPDFIAQVALARAAKNRRAASASGS